MGKPFDMERLEAAIEEARLCNFTAVNPMDLSEVSYSEQTWDEFHSSRRSSEGVGSTSFMPTIDDDNDTEK